MKTQVAKQADIRFRIELKAKPWIVIYKVRSSDDTQDYDVTVVNSKVNNCTCPARKPCYHMVGVQAREDAHIARNHAEQERLMVALSAEDEGLRFNSWHGSNYGAERPIDERGTLSSLNGFSLLR